MIRWNEWDKISPRTAPVPISVIVPARTDQRQLNRFLEALAQQDYPLQLIEVVVVDHRSLVPLVAPSDLGISVRVVRLEDGAGPGAARRYGARVAGNDIFLFLDVDILAGEGMIRNYVRWPTSNSLAVGLGFREFVDPGSIPPDALDKALADGGIDAILSGMRSTEGQEWIDSYLEKCDDARAWRDDLWIVVVGAGIAVSRELYEFSGGFRDFPTHGVEDTEFGYRLFQSGAYIVPDREARGYHLGLRTISRDRDRINWNRAGGLANEIPHPRYRAPLPGRIWSVPTVLGQIAVVEDADVVLALRTVDDLLANSYSDLGLLVHVAAGVDASILREYFAGEARVAFAEGLDLQIPMSSPVTLRVKPGVRFAHTSLQDLMKAWKVENLGLACAVAGSDDVSVELWRTAALARSSFLASAGEGAVRDILRASFKEEWYPAGKFGISYESGAASNLYKKSHAVSAVYYQ